MNVLFEVPGARLFFELVVSPAIESGLLAGVYAIFRSVVDACSASPATAATCFIFISSAFGFFGHGGLGGELGKGIVLAIAFALFAAQLVWMKVRYDWSVCLFGLFLSHFSFNLTPYIWP